MDQRKLCEASCCQLVSESDCCATVVLGQVKKQNNLIDSAIVVACPTVEIKANADIILDIHRQREETYKLFNNIGVSVGPTLST